MRLVKKHTYAPMTPRVALRTALQGSESRIKQKLLVNEMKSNEN